MVSQPGGREEKPYLYPFNNISSATFNISFPLFVELRFGRLHTCHVFLNPSIPLCGAIKHIHQFSGRIIGPNSSISRKTCLFMRSTTNWGEPDSIQLATIFELLPIQPQYTFHSITGRQTVSQNLQHVPNVMLMPPNHKFKLQFIAKILLNIHLPFSSSCICCCRSCSAFINLLSPPQSITATKNYHKTWPAKLWWTNCWKTFRYKSVNQFTFV